MTLQRCQTGSKSADELIERKECEVVRDTQAAVYWSRNSGSCPDP